MAAIEQIPFFLSEVPDINIASLKTIDQAKSGVMTRFITRAKQVHGVGTQTLLNTYRQWNSATENSIANLISQELNQLMNNNYNNPKMTGANFAKDVIARIESGVGIGPYSDIEQYGAMAQEIEHRLNSMIDVLMREKPTIELAALCNCIGRKIPDPDLAKKYEGKGVNLTGIEGKKAQTLQTLKNYYESLLAAGKGNVTALSVLGNDEIPSPEKVAKAVAGTLSSVAGESFYEILVTLVANRVMKQFNEVNEQIIKDFLAAGFSLTQIDERARQSSDVDLSGQQGKPDLYITWNENGLIIHIGGSVKFRQANNDFVNGKFMGKISYSLSLREVFNYADQLIPNASLSFTGALAAILRTKHEDWGDGYTTPADIESFKKAWDEIKQRAALMGVVDKFAGTGETNQFGEANFADVLIINQEVVPMYKIFQDISLTGFSGATSVSGGGWTWTFGHYNFPYWHKKNRQKYHSKAEKNNGEALRISLYESMMESIYNKKIQISFSLNKLT